jgi:hypothetical protein
MGDGAGAKIGMGPERPTAARGFTLDGDVVARPVGGIAAQRILSHAAAGKAQVDVGARLPGRQLWLPRMNEGQVQHIGRDMAGADHLELHDEAGGHRSIEERDGVARTNDAAALDAAIEA